MGEARRLWALLSLAVLASLAGVPAAGRQAAPVSPPRQIFAVVANPLAAEAGMAVLRRGGSAVDASIAIQAMLSLVEPQSSSVAGGAFMTFYDGRTRAVTVYDGRETAPAGATPALFLDAAGKPLPFPQAVLSGRATGVPGVLRLLKLAHDDHGKLPWQSLFGDAERTAREGFVISPRLGRFLQARFPQLGTQDTRAYFSKPDGTMMQPGDRLANPAYAAFLVRLAAQGPDALYTGETAQRIVAKTHADPLPGTMTLDDLARYRPVKRQPLCGPFGSYRVCTPPPPASGVGTLELLGLLDRTDVAKRGPGDARAWLLFAEASRLMYADRDRYVGDPAFTTVPVAGLLAPAYLDSRARLIGDRAGAPPAAGRPAGAPPAANDNSVEPTGTSHFLVGDAAGNVVSMTTTVESIFGTGRMVDGFFLNNQLTDFAFVPRDAAGNAVANAPAPGKRPRSSMTPLILLDKQGRFAGGIGSAGGNAILAYVGKSLMAAVDWKLPMQDAIALPNLVARGPSFSGETDKFAPGVAAGLAERGIRLQPGQGEDSGVQGVIVRGGRIEGGYDPRREGRALFEPAPATTRRAR